MSDHFVTLVWFHGDGDIQTPGEIQLSQKVRSDIWMTYGLLAHFAKMGNVLKAWQSTGEKACTCIDTCYYIE